MIRVPAELRRLIVPPTASLRAVLQVINDGGHAIAFVRDVRQRIVGTLTDGDVRRAILAGHDLDARVAGAASRRDFTWVGPQAPRSEVLDLMRARAIGQVPILRGGHLVGLHLLRELVGGRPRPNWAVIMAGGKGTRLRPITDRIPKPMLPVAGRPILERLVLHLTGFGVRRIFLSVNHLAEVIERHFADGARFGCRIEYLREREPLGTGGALRLLPERPRAPLIVLNGDLVTQFDVEALLDFHQQGGYAMTFGLRPHAVEIPFGVARVRGNRVVALEEKPTVRHMINAGIYALSPAAVRLVPPGQVFPITSLFERCTRRGLTVGAFPILEEWTDVGRPEELRRARGEA